MDFNFVPLHFSKQLKQTYMKKFLLFVFISGFVFWAKAQDQSSNGNEPRNVVKFLPFTLPFNSLSFEYERMINAKNSLILDLGFPDKKSIMGKFGIATNSDLKSAEIGSSLVRGAYRHYTGKQNFPKGFYIEPYLKYQHFTGDARVEGVDDFGVTYAGTSEIKLHTLNMGCQLGIQFLIAKRVSLDFYFLGFEGGLLNGKITTVPPTNTGFDQEILTILRDQIQQVVDGAPSMIKNKITVSQTNTSVDVKVSNAPYPWFRSGLSIGFAF